MEKKPFLRIFLLFRGTLIISRGTNKVVLGPLLVGVGGPKQHVLRRQPASTVTGLVGWSVGVAAFLASPPPSLSPPPPPPPPPATLALHE